MAPSIFFQVQASTLIAQAADELKHQLCMF